MPNAMNMYAMKDTPGFFSRSPIMSDLSMLRQGVLDPEEFINKYRQNLTKGTIDNLISYGMQGSGGAMNAANFAKFRQQREMEMAKRRAEQGPVTPNETNAMNY